MQRYRKQNLYEKPRATKQTSAQRQQQKQRACAHPTPADSTAKKNSLATRRLPDCWPAARPTPANRHPATREHATPQRYATSYPERALLTGVIELDVQYAANDSPPKKTCNGGRGGAYETRPSSDRSSWKNPTGP